MRTSLSLVVLFMVVGLVAASSPIVGARAEPSKRYASPVEARTPNQPSARHAARSKPSARYVARGPQPSARSPEPSKGTIARRDVNEQSTLTSLDAVLCPFRMSACPVEPASGFPKSLAEWTALDHECVDFETDLQSCGGCASIDTSHDCSAMPGALNVACVSGACQFQSCETGYHVSSDSKYCIANWL